MTEEFQSYDLADDHSLPKLLSKDSIGSNYLQKGALSKSLMGSEAWNLISMGNFEGGDPSQSSQDPTSQKDEPRNSNGRGKLIFSQIPSAVSSGSTPEGSSEDGESKDIGNGSKEQTDQKPSAEI